MLLKIIAFLMTALDGGRLLSIVTSKYGAALSCIVLGALNSCGLQPSLPLSSS